MVTPFFCLMKIVTGTWSAVRQAKSRSTTATTCGFFSLDCGKAGHTVLWDQNSAASSATPSTITPADQAINLTSAFIEHLLEEADHRRRRSVVRKSLSLSCGLGSRGAAIASARKRTARSNGK